ncbi:MBL fold metallo-hydrolase [Halapricum salinum]|uniref:MBL fold metallo-hydrolase n=1 Tax=Halapricum salinum TaxID=1457250 RepID=A0A4D6HDD5_9EURY|nr:MBL fold metallo-hydrolase [Halapricum salinum]QCC51993.1 MBL fold metallo-hydrolase [Halapricum salinum]
MAIGDVFEVTTGSCSDLYYVDTGMYDVEEYGSVYLLDDERPALVDTGIGTNYERILDLLDHAGVAPEDLAVIAVTHVHLDHAGGAGLLAEVCPNAEVYVHERGAPHLLDPTRLWEGTKAAVGEQIDFYTEPEPVSEDRLTTLTDGDEIDLGTHSLLAHHAPGHAPHQMAFEDPANDAVFTADAAGIYTPSTDEVHVTSPPPQFDLEQALTDVEMLADLDPETLLYAHFGPAPTADRLETYAERLDSWVADVAAVREDAESDEAVIEHFQTTLETPAVWSDVKARAEIGMNVRGVLRYLDAE